MIGLSTQACDVWRPTKGAVTAAGGIANEYTTPLFESIPVTVHKLSPGRREADFGIDSLAAYRGYIDEGVGVQREDILKITDGAFSGTYVLVASVFPMPGTDAVILELNDTKESPS